MTVQTYPDNREGEIARLENKVRILDDMLETGVLSSSIDGHTVTYRNQQAIEDTVTRIKVRLHFLRRGTYSPMGIGFEL